MISRLLSADALESEQAARREADSFHGATVGQWVQPWWAGLSRRAQVYLARPHVRHSEWAEEDHLKSAARFCWWGRRTLPHDGRDTRPPPPRRLMGAGRLWREQPQPFAVCKRSHHCPRAV